MLVSGLEIATTIISVGCYGMTVAFGMAATSLEEDKKRLAEECAKSTTKLPHHHLPQIALRTTEIAYGRAVVRTFVCFLLGVILQISTIVSV